MVLSYGNTLFKKTRFRDGEKDYRRLVSDLILKTYNVIGFDAINIGEYDLSLGVNYLKRWQKRMSLPFISANLKNKKGQSVFRPFRIMEIDGFRVGVLGLMKEKIHLSRIPDGNHYKIEDPFETAKEEITRMKAKRVNFIILLTDMTTMGCKKIVSLHLPVDIIIGSNRYNRYALPRIFEQRILLHLDRYGKHIGKLTLFCDKKGKGLWKPPTGEFSLHQSFHNAYVPIKKNFPQDEKIAQWMEVYLEKIRILKAQLAASHGEGEETGNAPPSGDHNKRYVGVKTCKKCHPKEFARWSETRHSRAYLSLIKKGSQYDEDCVGCHVVGFREKGGFKVISKRGMVPFVNVQCEACHGPGSLHVSGGGDITRIQRFVSRKTCLRCHTEEHSPDFIYSVYSVRLSCGNKTAKRNKVKDAKPLSLQHK